MIKICDRFKPFSLTPGEICMIPCSSFAVEAFPAEIRIFKDEESFSLQLLVAGPVKGFTLEQDLEKNVVRIFGRSLEGYYHFEISHRGEMIQITLKRGFSIPYQFGDKRGLLEKGQFIEILAEPAFFQKQTERLSLGMSKKLDWDKVSRRGDLKEILPVLFFLGQKAGRCDVDLQIQVLDDSFIKHQFKSILFPRRICDKRLGIKGLEIPLSVPVSAFLHKSYEAIRSLFIREENGKIEIDTSSFISGRMIGIRTAHAILDIEWTKGRLRKIRITPILESCLLFKWPKEIDSFRLKLRPQEKGRLIYRDNKIDIVPGKIIYLDKFQK